jgi:NCAIR mutase (PurE)-related protein
VVLATRVDDAGRRSWPSASRAPRSTRGRAPWWCGGGPARASCDVLVLCAGTADLPVAEEALVTRE